ncbi:hypothetical protein Q4Q34_14185 [Flavivirga abyssicola]|uniref:hypothetical protein n=1 Tax=Flavivirga abyssicola TaxID=3063533 RepID=UPI0026DF20FC|nr:hypothetical protein [Flavivirga sp. MEBiC07777]WVK12371.1 hypothetical protein Q4Q34_14185 [Flavivirga sp. MEBiC07777]
MISGNLEYLMSSLPYLSFQDTEEVRSKVAFLLQKYSRSLTEEKSLITILDDEAKKFLMPNNFNLLSQINNLNTIYSMAFQQSKNRMLADFSSYAFAMKEDIKQLRMSRRNGLEQHLLTKVTLPITPGDPLEEELQLLKLQWDKLEALSNTHYADFSALIIYKLKLLVLLRWWSFDKEKGFEIFLQTTKKD